MWHIQTNQHWVYRTWEQLSTNQLSVDWLFDSYQPISIEYTDNVTSSQTISIKYTDHHLTVVNQSALSIQIKWQLSTNHHWIYRSWYRCKPISFEYTDHENRCKPIRFQFYLWSDSYQPISIEYRDNVNCGHPISFECIDHLKTLNQSALSTLINDHMTSSQPVSIKFSDHMTSC